MAKCKTHFMRKHRLLCGLSWWQGDTTDDWEEVTCKICLRRRPQLEAIEVSDDCYLPNERALDSLFDCGDHAGRRGRFVNAECHATS